MAGPPGINHGSRHIYIWGGKAQIFLEVSDSVFSLVIRALSVSVYVCMCVSVCSFALFNFALSSRAAQTKCLSVSG